MPRPVHFEINADDPERALKFYHGVFGWTVDKWDGPVDYWLITTGEEGTPGINGGLMKRMDPSATVINTIDVPSVDDCIKIVLEYGGRVVLPKRAVPGVGYHAYCEDPEGNVFGIMEHGESA